MFSGDIRRETIDGFNIVVPDLIGYGKSSESTNGDYGFETHVEKLWKIIVD